MIYKSCAVELSKRAMEREQTQCNYQGETRHGKRHGVGVQRFYDRAEDYTLRESSRYEGEWKDDQRHGHGVFHYPTGNRYEGEWKDGMKHGVGVQHWPSGHCYEGGWCGDKRDGHGVYHSPDGTRYEGEWRGSKQVGRGILLHGSKQGGSRSILKPSKWVYDNGSARSTTSLSMLFDSSSVDDLFCDFE